MKEYGWKWPQIIDTNRAKAKRFGVLWQPAVIVIDAKGRIVAVDQLRARASLEPARGEAPLKA